MGAGDSVSLAAAAMKFMDLAHRLVAGALMVFTSGVAVYGLNGWKQADKSLHVLGSSPVTLLSSNTDVLP